MNPHYLLALLTAATLLSGCETQRTVLKTESRMSFGDQWSQQLGDVDGLKDKFASGFEIRDGRAVVAGEKEERSSRRDKKSTRFNLNGEDMELPKSSVKKIRTGPLARFANDDDSEVERFAGVSNFDTDELNRNSFDAGDSPSDSRKVAPWADRDSNMREEFAADSVPSSGKTYETDADREADKIFATEANRDEGRRFDFRGRRSMERSDSYEQRTAQRVKAEVNITNPADLDGSMTVDDVRRLLNPGGSTGS
tara:strand:+ start:24453 stop:25211 length:759 start_codon:yes stop_codon:yes gene_type:complete